MGLVFSTIGGSGSSYLISQLRQKFDVGNKPDAVFQDILEPLNIDAGTFAERSGIGFQPKSRTPELAIIEFLNHIQSLENYALVSNLAHEMNLLSRLKIFGTNFLIRDPIDAYNSFYSNPRQKPKIVYLGGVNHKNAIDYYMHRWVTLAAEYGRLLDIGCRPNLIRYEHFRYDVENIAGLEFLAENFILPKRRTNEMTMKTQNYIIDKAKAVARWELRYA